MVCASGRWGGFRENGGPKDVYTTEWGSARGWSTLTKIDGSIKRTCKIFVTNRSQEVAVAWRQYKRWCSDLSISKRYFLIFHQYQRRIWRKIARINKHSRIHCDINPHFRSSWKILTHRKFNRGKFCVVHLNIIVDDGFPFVRDFFNALKYNRNFQFRTFALVCCESSNSTQG